MGTRLQARKIAQQPGSSSYPHRARPLRTFCILGLVSVAALLILSLAGRLLVVDTARPCDVILVLDGENGNRLEKGLQLLNSSFGKELIVDADARQHWLGRTEAERLASSIASRGDVAPRVHVCAMTAATSTFTEAKEVERCIQPIPATKITIVTSDFHTRRALSIFRHVLPRYQWAVAPVEDPDTFGTPSWRHVQWLCTTMHEWQKLVWWEAVERWTA